MEFLCSLSGAAGAGSQGEADGLPPCGRKPPGQVIRSSCCNMYGDLGTIRLSIGLLDEFRMLLLVVQDLAACGLLGDSFSIIGMPDWLTKNAGSADLSKIPEGLQMLPADSLEKRDDILDWLTEEQRARLKDHVEHGGTVLVIRADTPEQQSASCRALLRHTQRAVQSHDFTMKRQYGAAARN